jgi:transposase
MRFIRELNPETRKSLKRISRESKSFQTRERAKCMILSYQGFSTPELMKIFSVSRKTIYNWFTRWEDPKLIGLYHQKGRGQKSQFNSEQKKEIRAWAKANPKTLNRVLLKVKTEWGVTVSKDTIKRIIKKSNLVWKRMKRGMSKSPDEWELEVKMPQLEELKKREQKGEIDLRYLDEIGFSLMPYMPYGWPEKSETIVLKSCRSKRINVIGLMNRKNELYYNICADKIDREFVMNFGDKFSETLSKTTVVVMDRASIHASDLTIEKLAEWESKKLHIFGLATYSPKQNLIEILWKFVKDEWIEIEAYASWNSLLAYLKKVLDNFGKEYVINFA